jgi:hypothetical protein
LLFLQRTRFVAWDESRLKALPTLASWPGEDLPQTRPSMRVRTKKEGVDTPVTAFGRLGHDGKRE